MFTTSRYFNCMQAAVLEIVLKRKYTAQKRADEVVL